MYLIRIDAAANMSRYYQIELSADLFGGALMIRRWGRIGRRGQERRHWFDDLEAAATAQQAWVARKLQRGYRAEQRPEGMLKPDLICRYEIGGGAQEIG